MTVDQGRLTATERRALLYGPVYRVVGTPVVAALGLANTAIIVRQVGAEVFGLVSLIATVTLLFPFADLGIGATVLSASAQLDGPDRDPQAANVIRRGYHVLFAVSGLLVLLALGIMAFDGWAALVGFASGPDDRWAITAAACIFALSIPAVLGLRILVGINRLPLATLLLMSCPAFALAVTFVLHMIGAAGIWYATSALGGLLIGEVIATAVALRLCGLGWSAFARTTQPRDGRRRLLAGSMWLFIVGVGSSIGLQTGRVLLAHLSTPVQLSQYALMAQIYGLGWSAFSIAGVAYWPVFVKRRTAIDESVRMWWRATAAFAGIAAIAMLAVFALGPLAARVLSGGRIDVSAWLALAFGALLVAQTAHLPSSVLLTRPNEARWQALWALAMAVLSVGLGAAAAAQFGAVGVVYASALAVLAAQVVPDLAWVPRLVRRRPRVTACAVDGD
ncbi:MAG TPA: oligosaccharide flippase family protein [Mycobacterium sp.]|jgi:O-antigen/teichoic acid export membrane protein